MAVRKSALAPMATSSSEQFGESPSESNLEISGRLVFSMLFPDGLGIRASFLKACKPDSFALVLVAHYWGAAMASPPPKLTSEALLIELLPLVLVGVSLPGLPARFRERIRWFKFGLIAYEVINLLFSEALMGLCWLLVEVPPPSAACMRESRLRVAVF